MEHYYLILTMLLLVLAVVDLVVGVSNDAVNFLNSAIGSKVASRHWILLVASVGVLVGAVFSSGMMEIARKGIFRPEFFYMNEIMIIFVAVMLSDIIILDLFNSLGLPTSTTVSIVFELLGSAVAVSLFKIIGNGENIANMANYINSGKALAIISGILVSVVVAFTVGSIVQFIARMLFSFNYQKSMKWVGSIWGGIALTAITYFIVIKGLKATTLVDNNTMEYILNNIPTLLLYSFLLWTIIFQVFISIFKTNILRFVVLMGTFALALAFAGNDLVNFIGVSMAGLKSYQVLLANPGVLPNQLLMSDLAGPVNTNTLYLLIAGFIMVITLWTSRKAQRVTKTEIGLSKQEIGYESFGSTQLARVIVRISRNFSKSIQKITPKAVSKYIDSRFDATKARTYHAQAEAPAYDLIRASVNLVVASILISSATSLKLPLSTTYVTFMVAMGSSLSDRAWGRESAVYRITGVFTVIAGWFLTAFIAFTLSFIVAAAIYYGKAPALIIIVIIAIAILIKSQLVFRKKEKEEIDETAEVEQSIVQKCTTDVKNTLEEVIKVFSRTIDGLTSEDRKLLKHVNADVEDLNLNAKKLKYNVYNVLKQLEADSIETGHYYIQVIDYLREIAHSLTFVSTPSLQHIENNHKGLSEEQAMELKSLSKEVSKLFNEILTIIMENDFTEIPDTIKHQQDILDLLNKYRKKQVKRIKNGETGTRISVLYLGIQNEIKNILLQSINLLKAQRDFILNNVE